jgi:hypothetical protein
VPRRSVVSCCLRGPACWQVQHLSSRKSMNPAKGSRRRTQGEEVGYASWHQRQQDRLIPYLNQPCDQVGRSCHCSCVVVVIEIEHVDDLGRGPFRSIAAPPDWRWMRWCWPGRPRTPQGTAGRSSDDILDGPGAPADRRPSRRAGVPVDPRLARGRPGPTPGAAWARSHCGRGISRPRSLPEPRAGGRGSAWTSVPVSPAVSRPPRHR